MRRGDFFVAGEGRDIKRPRKGNNGGATVDSGGWQGGETGDERKGGGETLRTTGARRGRCPLSVLGVIKAGCIWTPPTSRGDIGCQRGGEGLVIELLEYWNP